MANKKKTEEQILFPETNVCGIIIKPWAFGMLFELSESLDAVLDKADQKGILDNIINEDGVISYITMARILALANEEVLQIISTTIDKSHDEIKAYDMAKGIKIALTIFNQNKETIKNALSQMEK